MAVDPAATIVNVPELVNVCIVCDPLVVIVPPVELVETPSDPSVAYDMITIPLHPDHPLLPAYQPPPPQPVFAVQFCGDTPLSQPFHPPPVHPVHFVQFTVIPHHPHPAYTVADPDIELLVPFPPAHHVTLAALAQLLDAPHPPAPAELLQELNHVHQFHHWLHVPPVVVVAPHHPPPHHPFLPPHVPSRVPPPPHPVPVIEANTELFQFVPNQG